MLSLAAVSTGPILLVFSIVLLSCFLVNRYNALRRNIKLAKEIDLPYVVLPFYTSTLPWLILGPLIVPVLRFCLPDFVNRKWIDYMLAFWTWYLGYEPFQRLGSDTIMTVAPGGITFWTCSPEVISQIGARGRDFPKPVEYYKVLDIFGSNILSCTGPNWRRQRKCISPSFNEANNALVFDESIFQTTSMLQSWAVESKYKKVNFQEDFKMLAFHVLSRGGFGVRLLWAGHQEAGQEQLQQGHEHLEKSSKKPFRGMRFGEAMLLVVENMKEIFVFPNWFLKYAPSKLLNRSWLAHREVTRYMHDFMNGNKNLKEKEGTRSKQGLDILSSLSANSLQREPGSRYSEAPLTENEIVANVFATMIAGHETAGSTLFHAMIMLAINPYWQQQMQSDIDSIFRSRNPAQWSYSEDIKKLFRSTVDAVLCETLRLYPPANLVPKRTAEGPSQVLKYKNREIHVPGDVRVNILVASVHRNPNYFPTNPHPFGLGTDINDFRPSRWFAAPESDNGSGLDMCPPFTPSSPSIFSSESETKEFFRPKKGAFVPFSIGQRECIGKRFARIEMLVCLAVIFRDWSVELIVEGENRMSMGKRWMAWEDERERIRGCLQDGMEHYMTMQLGKGQCPMRIVRRGQEKYADMR